MFTQEILTDLYGQQIKKIKKTEWGDILITLANDQVIKVIGSEYDGSVDVELGCVETIEQEIRYCAICGLAATGCQHSGVKYTMNELYILTEVGEM